MKVSRIKELVRENGGEVTDTGYVTVGRGKVAHIEAYYEDREDVPKIPEIETDDETVVDNEWDPDHNGVMYEVELASRP